MVNDEQHNPNAAGRYGDVPAPETSWGGEYDAEATAFIQLPPSGPDGPFGTDPLAAPGHGYRPPEIGTAAGPYPPGGPVDHHRPAPGGPPPADPVVVGATTDPAATGAWAMPFAAEQDRAPAPAPAPAGDAAAMGQGAAAALAGAHQGRIHRRPLGEGPAPEAGPLPSPGTPATTPVMDAADRTFPAQPHPDGHHHPPHAPEPREPQEPQNAAPASHPGRDGDGPAGDVPDPDGPLPSEHPTVSYVLRVNGIDRPVTDAWIGESLLHVLRERLGLAGAKDGCSQGECGACSVQVDGRLVVACLVPAATSAGSEIRTVEGLSSDGVPSDVQRALAGCEVQCGFCLPGMAMTVHDLLEGNHSPNQLETRQALCGNLCRCTGYRGVLDAVRQVVAERSGDSGDAAGEAEHAERSPGEAGSGAEGRIPQQSGPPDGSLGMGGEA